MTSQHQQWVGCSFRGPRFTFIGVVTKSFISQNSYDRFQVSIIGAYNGCNLKPFAWGLYLYRIVPVTGAWDVKVLLIHELELMPDRVVLVSDDFHPLYVLLYCLILRTSCHGCGTPLSRSVSNTNSCLLLPSAVVSFSPSCSD